MTTYILHHNSYWTEYVDFLLRDRDRYRLIASRTAVEGYGSDCPLEGMERFDPKKHRTILTPGRLHDATSNNRIVMRFMHSPGFFLYPLLRAYADLVTSRKGCDYRFLLAEEYYKALMVKEIESEALDHFRYLLLSDKRVSTLKVDLKLVEIYNRERRREREEGRALLALSWLLIDNDFSRFIDIVEAIGRRCRLSLLLHPLMRMNDSYLKRVLQLEGIAYEKAFYNLQRDELVDLYDSSEFIASDGSGSCYEAMARGCLPYAVRGLRSVTADESFNEELDFDYLPFPPFESIGEERYGESEEFLSRFFPYLTRFSPAEAEAIAKGEIDSITW